MKTSFVTGMSRLILFTAFLNIQATYAQPVTHEFLTGANGKPVDKAIKAPLPVSPGKNLKDSDSVSVSPGSLNNSNSFLNDINIHAIRDFIKRFDNPIDIKWTKVKKGYIAACTLKGTRSTVAYDIKGEWVYTIKYYEESKLPRSIRAIVKRIYYDYTITLVEEIVQQINNEPVYLVHIKDESTCKIVLVDNNGEMVVIEDHDNA